MVHPTSLRKSLLAAFALVCATVSTGCFTPPVLALARSTTKRQTYETSIEKVSRAARVGDGGLLVCIEIQTWQNAREEVHLTVPLGKLATLAERKSLDFGRDAGFESGTANGVPVLRYVFFEKQLEPGCPAATGELPVLPWQEGAQDAGLYTRKSDRDAGLALRYRSSDALWSSIHDVDLAPVLGGEKVEKVPGRPAYYLVLPFAVLLDTLVAVVYLFPIFT